MDKAERRRWTILLAALAMTVGAIFYPVEQGSDTGPVSAAERPSRRPPAATPLYANAADGVPATEADPFAPRGWEAPPPPAPVPIAAPVAAEPVLPPAPVGPPPLPFQFMGRLNDGGTQVVYLSRGDQTLIARDGETLDNTYKVLGIDAQHIEFEHLPTGEKQTLPIAAPDK